MPSRCCVPLCKGNYPTGPKVSVFSFPKNDDSKKKWIYAIQRKNFYPNQNSRICELHFTERDFEKDATGYDEKSGKLVSVPLKVRRLKQEAIPSVFQNFPVSYVSKTSCTRKCPDDRKMEKEMLNLDKVLKESQKTYKEYNNSRKVNCLSDIKKCVEQFGISKFWTFHNNSGSLFFLYIIFDPEPFIKYSVKIDDNLNLTVSIEKNPIQKLEKFSFPLKVRQFNDVINILDAIEMSSEKQDDHNHLKSVINLIICLIDSIKSDENENSLKFIQQQLHLLLSPSNHFRYTTDLLIFACILKTISPHAYNFIRQSENVILPHPDTLRKICNNLQVSPQLELHDENFLMYISSRVTYLSEFEKTVILMIDEIHIKPYFDYKGGSIVGAGFNTNKAATSAFVYMISSILSPFKEVVHILPVNCINFQILHDITKKVIVGLENVGLKVICTITDNNSINAKAMSLFTKSPHRSYVYPHPIDPNRPMFFLIDSVHIFKNIRNNWLNQKNVDRCFFFPDFDNPKNSQCRTASFKALRKIHEIDSNKIISFAKGLTLKSLSPSNLERQNVKLVLKIFNKFVVEALATLGPQYNIPHFNDTATFISIICKWWDIFNVKTAKKGIHQRNVYMEPLNGDDLDEKYIFLKKFLIWLDAWEAMQCSTGALSKETHKALVQTTHGMLELTSYCIDECKMKYILTGKIQTDSLEARFGKYRQLAGSQYHISIRQLLECEKRLRLQSCVKLELFLSCSVVPLKHFDTGNIENISDVKQNIDFKDFTHINIECTDTDDVKPFLPVLTYLGGYCSYSLIKKLKCDYCKENLVLDSDVNLDENYNLIKNLDRGGLKCPTQFVVTYVMFNYIIVNHLYSDFEHFIKISNQREVAIKLTYDELKSRELVLDYECPSGHSSDYICKLILCSSTNIMLKNLCIKENDNLIKIKESKKNSKRKLETLKN